MPKRAEMKDEGQVHQDLTADRTNGINEQQLKDFVDQYEAELIEIDTIMENARVAAQPHNDQCKAIAKAAAEAGIEKKAFKAKIRERALKRKAERVTDSLSERQKDIFAEITLKLGELPLFRGLDEQREAA